MRTSVRQSVALWWVACALGGCLADVTPKQTPTPSPTSPTTRVVASLAPGGAQWTSELMTSAQRGLRVDVTSGAVWAWDDQGQLWRIDQRGHSALKGVLETSQLYALVEDAQGDVLAATDEGLKLINQAGKLSESPISAQLGSWPIEAMLRDAKGRLWFGSSRGLWLHEAGQLSSVAALDGVAVTSLVKGPDLEAHEGALNQTLWLSSTQGLLALDEDPQGGYSLYKALTAQHTNALVATGGGQALWMLSDGEVFYRAEQGKWLKLELEQAATALRANINAADVWIAGANGEVYHWSGELLNKVEGLSWPEGAMVDAQGRLLSVSSSGAINVHDRRYRVWATEPDAPLTETLAMPVQLSFPDRLAQLEADLGDGQLVPVMDQALTLEPGQLGAGEHKIVLKATYQDKQVARYTMRVEVGQFDYTWTDHVEPLFKARCSTCHGERAYRELHKPEKWQADFDNILDQVERGLMPLPPFERLNAAELRMLRQWKEGGFQ